MRKWSFLFLFLLSFPLCADSPGKKARVYTLEDLEHMPEITVLGAETELEPDPAGVPEPSNEAQWRKKARALQLELAKLGDIVDRAEKACTEERMAPFHMKRSKGSIEDLNNPPSCVKAEEAKQKLEAAEERWSDFEDEARHAEVPHSWLD